MRLMSSQSILANTPRFAPVILAGGSGTRFWPRSRRSRAKQVLALDGDQTMIQETLGRLEPLAAAEDVWVITNDLLRGEITEQLPNVKRDHILSEPAARNTAPGVRAGGVSAGAEVAGGGAWRFSVGPCGDGSGAV